MNEDSDEEAQEKRYSSDLLRAYAYAFPPISASVGALQEKYGWTPEDAMKAVTGLASAPVIDHCLHRGQAVSRRMCIPHLVLDCLQKGAYEDLPSQVTGAVLNGEKLTSKQKAVLGLLRDRRERALFTLAYASNRCYAGGFSAAVVVLFFEADGVAHANMIMLERGQASLSVTVYEPNGAEAAKKYATEARFFSHLPESLAPLVGRPVSFRFVGLALQTYLGQRLVRRSRRSLSIVERGYPVCQAAVLWLFSLFVEANTTLDLAEFEAELMKKDRRELKLQLLSWILALKAWVKSSYAERMTAKIDAVFRDTNVVNVDLRYGSIKVVWSSEDDGV
jgi:hypothetical protein